MLIRITAELIKSGRVGSSLGCPLAMAINDLLHPDYYLVVTVKRLLIKSRLADGTLETKFETELSNEAQVFISRFDNRLSVEPIDFELDIPQEFLRWPSPTSPSPVSSSPASSVA